MKVRIESVHFNADEKLQAFIEEKVNKLTNYYERIIDAHVVMKLENSGQVRDKIVEAKIQVPGDVIFSKSTEKTFESAMDKLHDTLKRNLLKHKELQRAHR